VLATLFQCDVGLEVQMGRKKSRWSHEDDKRSDMEMPPELAEVGLALWMEAGPRSMPQRLGLILLRMTFVS